MAVVRVEILTCRCGRAKSAAQKHVYHSRDLHHTYFLCDCGEEWSLEEHDIDPIDPVTSDEIIELHQRLAQDDLTLDDLLH